MDVFMPPPDLVEIASLYWQSAALNAAVELRLFETLAPEAQSAASLAKTLDCSVPHLEALLDSLSGMGILHKTKEKYTISQEVRPLLDPASGDCLLEALAFNRDLFALWLKLPDCIRHGQPAVAGNPHLGADPERLKRFVRGMHSRAGIMARPAKAKEKVD